MTSDAVSRHCGGARRSWARAPKQGLRPVVHVALGSHANYFAASKELGLAETSLIY